MSRGKGQLSYDHFLEDHHVLPIAYLDGVAEGIASLGMLVEERGEYLWYIHRRHAVDREKNGEVVIQRLRPQ